MTARDRLFPGAAIGALLVAIVSGSAHAATWNQETISGALLPSPSLVLDAAGVPHVAYNSGGQPRVVSRVAGTWVGENLTTPVAASGKDGGDLVNLIYYVTPSLQLADAEPRVLYHKAPESDLWFATRNLGTWSYERLSLDAYTPSLTFDRDGAAHVAFYDSQLGPRYGMLGAGGWALEAAPGTGSMALEVAGRAHLAYTTGGAIEWARRDAGGWITETCEAVGGNGVSIAVDGAGDPHVAFVDSYERIRHAHRANGVWTVATVASGVGPVIATSIALGAGGEPFIAYYNATAGDFCFARRTAGVWGHEVVEHTYAGQEGCSLAIDAAGRPRVTYFSAPTTLRYATTTTAVTGVEPPAATPGFALASAKPNPLRTGGALDLALRLDAPRSVTLELLDLAGRRVAGKEPTPLGAGAQRLSWTPRVATGGLYFLAVRSDCGERLTTRLALLP